MFTYLYLLILAIVVVCIHKVIFFDKKSFSHKQVMDEAQALINKKRKKK